ncbi:glutamate racemase [Candidatus Calescamantes bacterium]|nr:glutamate racemase [Candidatus Calescamantes bacterium]
MSAIVKVIMNQITNNPIGIFDSGVGGLTVLHQLLQLLPEENFVYFGDTARVPYGSKSRQTITHFSFQDVNFLLSQEVKMVVVACNSASSNSLSELKAKYEVPIFGVIEPTITSLSEEISKIGIIGTSATIESGSYQKMLKQKLGNEALLYEKACPLFVQLAEEGLSDSHIADTVIEHYLSKMKANSPQALILGCTHYPLFINSLQRYFGDSVSLVNPALEVAKEVHKYIHDNGLENKNGRGDIRFYLSDVPRNFGSVSVNFLQREIEDITKIDIERY